MSDHPPTSRFLRACAGLPADTTPVWFMRQAGRYMSEYRSLRERYDFLELATDADLITEVTLQPIRAMDLDAAIVFADIMTPLEGIGVDYTIESGVGPVVAEPLRQATQVEGLRPFDPERDVPFLLTAIGRIVEELDDDIPLIGFAGAPFTLASYLIEGRGRRSLKQTKRIMYSAPEIWHALMDHLADTVTVYLRAQIESGVAAVQLFDSWVGAVAPDDYREYVAPYSRRIFENLVDEPAATIHFGTGTATLLPQMAEMPSDVIGADWRIPLGEAWERIGPDKAIQGNLDPCVLFADFDEIRRHATRILEAARGRPGHVFNLGHGILPGTPVDNVRRLVDFVHELGGSRV